MITTAAGLLGHAVELGLVSVSDVLDGRATVHERSRSNIVHRLALDGQAVAFAKQAGPAHHLDGVDAVAHERAVLERLDGLRGVPRLLPAPDGQLWTVPVPGVPVAELDLARTPVDPVAAAWGTALAGVHTARVARTSAVLAPRPWVLDPVRLPRWMRGPAEQPAPAAVLAELQSGGALAAAVAHTVRTWRSTSWVHGDAGAHNVLAVPGESTAGLIDFEDAGLGDPSWDLACALASLELLVTSWGLPSDTAAQQLLAAYAGHGGPGHQDQERSAVATALLAWQLAAAGPATAQRSGELLDRAVELAGGSAMVGAR